MIKNNKYRFYNKENRLIYLYSLLWTQNKREEERVQFQPFMQNRGGESSKNWPHQSPSCKQQLEYSVLVISTLSLDSGHLFSKPHWCLSPIFLHLIGANLLPHYTSKEVDGLIFRKGLMSTPRISFTLISTIFSQKLAHSESPKGSLVLSVEGCGIGEQYGQNSV